MTICHALKLKAQDGKYFMTNVTNIVGVLSESKDGRKYRNKLKTCLKEKGNETVTNCHQLKLKSSDSKYYNKN